MKKRGLIAAVLAAVVLLGAVAAYGAADDSALISLSFLQGKYKEEVQQSVLEQAEKTLGDAEQAAENKLDRIGQSVLGSTGDMEASDWNQSGSAVALSGVKGNYLTLASGTVLHWKNGTADLNAGTLVDTSVGSALTGKGSLLASHQYIADGDVKITLGGNCYWIVEGMWKTDAVGAPITEPMPAVPLTFTDVKTTAWYYDGIAFVVRQGLFAGVSAQTFDLTSSMSRAMLASVLYRLAGSPSVEYSPMFSDVKQGSWYTPGVMWAVKSHVSAGRADGTFLPDEALGRQEIALMLYNYANYFGFDTSARGDLSVFPDADETADWAKDAIVWAVGSGMLYGADGKLLPADTATRAQVAVMLQRFFKWLS